jgi:hypothetical protein
MHDLAKGAHFLSASDRRRWLRVPPLLEVAIEEPRLHQHAYCRCRCSKPEQNDI